jgi:hypothetical protein
MEESVKAMGIKLGMSEKGAYLLGYHTDQARQAVKEIVQQAQSLLEALEGEDVDSKLGTLRWLAGHVGYSNSIGSTWAELATAAGAVNALLETI